MDDLDAILRAAQTGDLDAYGQLVRRFQDLAVAYAVTVLRDFHLAQDAAQEAFVEALPILDRVHSAQAFPAWLRRLVFKHCDRFTRRRTPDGVPLDSLSEPPESPGPDPYTELEASQRRHAVLAAVGGLPEEERLVTTLFYMGEYAHDEIARFLGLSADTVNNRLRAARRRLKQRLLAMTRETLRDRTPSHDDTFLNAVGICTAAERGDLDRVEEILKREPDLLAADHPRYLGRTRRQALHFAAEAGHLQVVRRLLEAGGDPLWGFFHNFHVPSPLTLARDRGHYLVVELMERSVLERVDVDPGLLSRPGEDDNTLLHKAVYHRHRPLVLGLLRRGAEADAVNERGQRPLHLALYTGMGGPGPMLRDPSYDLAALLLAHGAEVDIWVASAMGDTPAVCRLLDDDPSRANWNSGTRRYPGAACYPLAMAAHNGHLEVVRLLLDAGADPDIENDNEFREDDTLESGVPLVFAIARGHHDIAHLLLDRGARCDSSKIHSGPNIMAVAIDSGDPALLERVVVAGGRPFLTHYVETRNYVVVGELLDRCPHDPHRPGSRSDVLHELLRAGLSHGDVNVVDMCLRREPSLPSGQGAWGDGGLGLLHILMRKAYVRRGQPAPAPETWEPVLRRLLEYGLDVNDGDEHGVTALHLLANAHAAWDADEPTLVAMARRLVEAGADLSAVATADPKTTPLGWACYFGRPDLVACLLEAGTDPDLPANAPDCRPLALAEAQGFAEIVELLQRPNEPSGW